MLIMTSSKRTRLLSRDALSKRTTSQSGRRQHVSNISCFVLDRDYALAQWDSINILHLETNSLAELITVSLNISQPLLLQWNISDAAFLLLHLSDHLLPHNLFLRDLVLLWDVCVLERLERRSCSSVPEPHRLIVRARDDLLAIGRRPRKGPRYSPCGP